MKKIQSLLFMMAFLFVVCPQIDAASMHGTRRMITDAPNTQVRVHHESNIEFTVTNFGLIGSQDGQFNDPERPGQPALGFEFPTDSGLQYLFQGGIWIGATIDTFDYYGNPILDTLVSVGNDGWWGNIYELLPPPNGYLSLWEDNLQSDEDIHAVYTDTVTDPLYVLMDPNDGRPHIPIGIKVTQTSSCWSSPGYDEVFIINYYIENIRNRDAHNVWIGLYYDGDVYHISENPYGVEQGAQDDLCGFTEHGDHGIAWIIDNDGQPYGGEFTERSVRGASGMVLLRSSEAGLQTNFNWWISNVNSSLDWGPRRLHPDSSWLDEPFPGGGMGTPGGDRAKYQVMSNGEHDYDQAWSNIDDSYHPGWLPKPVYAGDLANGYDTRFLISFGPMQLNRNEIDTVTIALIGGRNIHNDPLNYHDHLQNSTADSESIATYYRGLDFSDLIAKADSAYNWFHNGYPHPPIGPPHLFRMTAWNDTSVTFAWNPRNINALAHYNIYRGTSSGIYDPSPIAAPPRTDSNFVDYNVQNRTTYYYVIASVDSLGRPGGYSPEIAVTPDQPHRPIGLTAIGGNQQVNLTWTANNESDLAGYIIYRKLEGQPFGIIDSSLNIQFSDYGVQNGFYYYYEVSAYDNNGFISMPSDSVRIAAMGLDQGILLLNNTNNNNNWYPNYDSILAFYNNILSGYRHAIRDARYGDSLLYLAPYSTIIFCSENPIRRRISFGQETINSPTFSDYLRGGGNLILIGPRNLAEQSQIGQINFNNQGWPFPLNYLNIIGGTFPFALDTSFIGGHSQSPDYTDFELDAARMNLMNEIPPIHHHLSGFGTYGPNESDEVIYQYHGNGLDTFNFEGQPIGIIHHGPNYKTATLEFPLYFIQEPQSYQILHTMLSAFGEFPTGVSENQPLIPDEISLMQNYPNPFNPATTLSYYLPVQGQVTLSIYNLLGQQIELLCDMQQSPGNHSIIWKAGNMPSGIYFARLQAGKKTQIIKMLLLK